jgi:diguanylate cyclase (GGDEF)-like protein
VTKHRLVPTTPHRQIALIGALCIVLGALVLTLGLTQLGGVRSDLARVDDELAPAALALRDAAHEYGDASRAFNEMLDSTDEAERAALLAEATTLRTRGNDAWLRFKEYADVLPRTRAAVENIDYVFAELNERGAMMLSNPTPDGRADIDRLNASVRTNIDNLAQRYSRAAEREIASAREQADTTNTSVLVVYSIVFGVIAVTTIAAVQITKRREHREALRDAERAARAERDELDARLQRALEMSYDEDATFAVLDAAMRRSIEDTPADLLVADSTRGLLRRVASTLDESCDATCGVRALGECPAVSRGRRTVFGGRDALDTCPTRARHGGAPAATTCVPVHVGGRPSGVICATGPVDTPIGDGTLSTVELIARKAGERLTLTRAFARSESLASTDPLTGLPNRRSTEERVEELHATRRGYVVAYGDLDHFKLINDVYGHDAGDRALRLFARTLRDAIRPSDLPCRFGGEEFVVVLPDCSVAEATAILERVRERLDAAIRGADVPTFTVSFGISQRDEGRPFEDVLADADTALRQAKADGRDRVVASRGSLTGGTVTES